MNGKLNPNRMNGLKVLLKKRSSLSKKPPAGVKYSGRFFFAGIQIAGIIIAIFVLAFLVWGTTRWNPSGGDKTQTRAVATTNQLNTELTPFIFEDDFEDPASLNN